MAWTNISFNDYIILKSLTHYNSLVSINFIIKTHPTDNSTNPPPIQQYTPQQHPYPILNHITSIIPLFCSSSVTNSPLVMLVFPVEYVFTKQLVISQGWTMVEQTIPFVICLYFLIMWNIAASSKILQDWSQDKVHTHPLSTIINTNSE